MSEWFEDETFWGKLYPFMFPERKFEIAEHDACSVLDLAGFGGR